MKTAILSACLLLALAACASPAPLGTSTPAPLPTVATATPIGLSQSDPENITRGRGTTCSLVTRSDMGGFFSAEVVPPIYHANATNVLPFSNERVAADEYTCVYLAFHLSGSASGNSYQVTYWVDKRGQTPAGEWAQVWDDSKSHAEQVISGVGDDAFYKAGRLTFKKGDTDMTIEVLASKLDTSTPEGVAQQIDYEKKIALKALSRWQ